MTLTMFIVSWIMCGLITFSVHYKENPKAENPDGLGSLLVTLFWCVLFGYFSMVYLICYLCKLLFKEVIPKWVKRLDEKYPYKRKDEE